MDEARKALLDAMAEEALALLAGRRPTGAPEAPGEAGRAPSAPSPGLAGSLFGAGAYAHPGLALAQDLVLDPRGRKLKSGATFQAFADLAPRLRQDPVLVLGGLSLFELEALAEARPGDELAEALVHVLGSQGRVILGADHRERFRGLTGSLASRLWRALGALQALGVDTADADPRKAPVRRAQGAGKLSGQTLFGPGEAAAARASLGGPSTRRVYTVADLRGLSRGESLALPEGALLTDLARDEAKARGIRIEEFRLKRR